jgi:uncharacterized protein YkwD
MRRFVLLACVSALVAVAPAGGASTASPPTVKKALAAAVLVQINAVRATNGLAPLTVNAQLSAAATQHSKEMLAHGYFGHDSLDGSSYQKRINRFYKGKVGENLLWSSPTVGAARALKLWMATPLHRAAILDRSWRAIGIGALHAAKAGGHYGGRPVTVITTDFGVRP